ncbi:MobA/MobL family protein [Fusobacterium nucleatum]
MSNYFCNISNSRSQKETGVLATEHYEYISRTGKYSPEEEKENQAAFAHLEYVQRMNNFSKKVEYEDLVYSENINMPSWAEQNPNSFWIASETYERANGRTYSEFLFSLPHELTDEENKEIVDRFCNKTFGKDFVYSYGIHSKPSSEEGVQNIHVHIMFCERRLDGIDRPVEQFFKRYNSNYPERGGAKKDRYWNNSKMFFHVRKEMEKCINEKLEEKGLEKVSCETLKAQRLVALSAGDILKAEFLDRPPVNCPGSILMKINKYGIESLTENEKEQYNLYLTTKEIRKISLEEYQRKLQEKNSKEFVVPTEKEARDFINNTKEIILDRAKFAVFESRKKLENINEFNSFEKNREAYLEEYLGMGVLISEEKNLQLKYNATLAFENYTQQNLNKVYEKKHQENFSSLKHNEFNFSNRYYYLLEKVSANLSNEKLLLEKNKEQLLNNYKADIYSYDKENNKKILQQLLKAAYNDSRKESIETILNKYKEDEEIERNLSKLNKNTFISKIFSNKSQEIEITKLNIEKEKIKEEIDKLFTSTFYNDSKLQTTFILKKLELLDKEKNTDTYKETENIFKDFYKKYEDIKEKLSVLEVSIQYTDEKIKEFSPFIQEQKKKLKEINEKTTIEKDFISPGVTSNNYIDTTVENIREQLLNSSKNREETLEDIIIKNNKMYSELKAIENKILSFEKILKDEKKIKEISIKKNLQPEKIIAGYQKSLEKNKEKIFDMIKEYKNERRKIQSSLATKNIFEKNKIYETILQTLENSRKRLFSELDNLKSKNEKTNIVFDEIKNNSWEIENFKKLFNKNIEKDKLKEDINPGKIKMEKVLDNTDVKISENIVSKEEKEISSEIKTVNSSKKSINNNDKKIRGNYINIIPKKKKRESLVDEDDLNIKEYGDD